MAEALAITTAVTSLTAFTAKMVESIGKFVYEYRSISSTITEFRDTISTFHFALKNLERTLGEHRGRRYEFERDHQKAITDILTSCRHALARLAEELPELSGDPGPMDRARASLEISLNRAVVANILEHLHSYTKVLQLSLTTLSLTSIWATQQSQDRVEAAVRKLTSELRSSNFIDQMPQMPLISRRGSAVTDWDDDDRTRVNQDVTFVEEIKAWRESADWVAAAVTLRGADGKPLKSPPSQKEVFSRASSIRKPVGGPSLGDDDDSDSDDEFSDDVNDELLEYQFKANQDIVSQLEKTGLYFIASSYQKRGIAQKRTLCEVRKVGFDAEEADMKERLSGLLLSCGTHDGVLEAKTILTELIKREEKLGTEDKDADRYCRLHHQLGSVNMTLGNLTRACRYLKKSYTERMRMDPVPYEQAKETADLLVKAYQLSNNTDLEIGLTNLIKQKIAPHLRRVSVADSVEEKSIESGCGGGPDDDVQPSDGFARMLEWSGQHGFHVDNPVGFRPDLCDPELKMSPLHKAVTEKNTDILLAMIPRIANFETGDEVGQPTPLLLAASYRYVEGVQLLLKNGALASARDNLGRTALHKCQSLKRGAVETAKLLLNSDPSIIDQLDNSGQTALYMAVDMGNEDMVRFLLSRDANPNIGQRLSATSVLCTPLIKAIEKASHKGHIVQALLNHGADPMMRDAYGRTPLQVAQKSSSLARGEIEKLLHHHRTMAGPRRSSQSSSSSAPQQPPIGLFVAVTTTTVESPTRVSTSTSSSSNMTRSTTSATAGSNEKSKRRGLGKWISRKG